MPEVLVVDDYEIDLDILRRRLGRSNDYDIFTASDGAMAIEVAREKLPDLIVMDMHMPNLFGSEAAIKMRADDQIKHISIIAVSSRVMKEDVDEYMDEYMDVGIDFVLPKPIDFNVLLDKIKEYTAGKKPA